MHPWLQPTKDQKYSEEFPGGLVVRHWCFYCCGLGSNPGQGTEILQDVWCGQKKKKKENLHLPHVGSFLHSLCIVFGVIINLEMI